MPSVRLCNPTRTHTTYRPWTGIPYQLRRPFSPASVPAIGHHDPPKKAIHQEAGEPEQSLSMRQRLPEFSLADKVIIVSGAAQGLGLTQAEALLEAGATVYAVDRQPSPSPAFNRVSARAQEHLGTLLHYRRIDVRHTESLDETVESIANEHGSLDGLIAAAGVQFEQPALEHSIADANRVLEINVTGVLATAQAVARQMVRLGKGGSIVAIASMSGRVANRGLPCSVYSASKGAVLQLARNLAAEWGQYNIRVNTISPGYIRTEMVEELLKTFPEREQAWPKENMLGRISVPEDYRGAAVFLMSAASSFMTGADLTIDGGHHAW